MDVAVVVADRCFEAWLLAGADGLHAGRKLKVAPKARGWEGAAGDLTKELGRLLGRPYFKTTDGPALFAALDLPTARARSRSLDKLLSTLLPPGAPVP